MEVIYLNNTNRDSYLSKVNPSVVAIGFFDGMHRGHQKVIKEARKIADDRQLPLACMSFFPHPKEVLDQNHKMQYIMPMNEKKSTLKKMGVDTFYIVQFDPEFAALSPKQFVQKYLLDLGFKYVVAGFDFTYGYRGEGNMDGIEKDADDRLKAIKVEKVAFKGEKISSTLIRKLIRLGEMEALPYYLGSHYQIEGKILLNGNKPEIRVMPHFLLPASGMYEVAISNREKDLRLPIIVERDRARLDLAFMNDDFIINHSSVKITWLKCLSSRVLSSV